MLNQLENHKDVIIALFMTLIISKLLAPKSIIIMREISVIFLNKKLTGKKTQEIADNYL